MSSNEQAIGMLFADSEFIVLESASRLLNEYISQMEGDTKDKYKRMVMIKELAKKKLKSTVLDDVAVGGLIREINEIYSKRNNINASNSNLSNNINRSFKNLIMEENISVDQELIKHNFIYNNSIIYVDAIRDIKLITNNVYKSFKINEEFHLSIFSNAIDKPMIYTNHFNLIKHFLMTNQEYKTKFQKNTEGMEISTLDCLQGKSEEVIVLGMIMLNEEGTLQLQDNSKIVNVDINECDWGKGYFTQGCVVLCQGFFKNEVLKAKAIVHPPQAWNTADFKERTENDFFGAITKAFRSNVSNNSINKNVFNPINNNINNINENNNVMSNKAEENFLLNFLNRDISQSKHLYPKTLDSHIHTNLDAILKSNYNQNVVERVFQTASEYNSEEFFIVISNPDLNNPNVLNAIEKIIIGYSNNNMNNLNNNDGNNPALPFMIIFIGNFTSESSFTTFKTYSTIFDNLANIILKNPLIVKNTYITIVPGPNDFSLFSGFPKHPIIENVIGLMKKKLPNVISATNPCRFTMFGKEVVIFRDNLNKKLARNSIVKCTDINKHKDFFIHTVLSQGNLSPFDLNVSSKIWHLSQSLTILPLPDFLILADVVEDFYMTNKKASVLNPGNFTKDFSFDIVYPLRNVVEPCKISLT